MYKQQIRNNKKYILYNYIIYKSIILIYKYRLKKNKIHEFLII